jgi:hypothetical protein
MGCFDYTCAISGLPIGAGDAVKYLLLQENPYQSNIRCYPYADWYIRTPAINAYYNDYGSIDRFNESDPEFQVMFERWDDVVELGVGDNIYHDIAVSIDMRPRDRLEAIWEDRVSVYKTSYRDSEDAYGQPSFKRIKRQLEELSCVENEFIVDEIHKGMVRLRWSGNVKKLNSCLKVLKKEYSCVKTCGSLSHVFETIFLFFPKPVKNKNDGTVPHLSFKDERKILSIRQTMVLKEVWDYIVNLTFSYPKNITFNDYILDPVWDFWLKSKQNGAPNIYELAFNDSIIFYIFYHSLECGPLRSAWEYALDKGWGEEFQKKWILSFCETAKFQYSLSDLRIILTQGQTCGEQHGGYKRHVNFAKFIAKLAKDKEKRFD